MKLRLNKNQAKKFNLKEGQVIKVVEKFVHSAEYEYQYIEFFKNPTSKELDSIYDSIPLDIHKAIRGFITNTGDLFIWNATMMHKDGLEMLQSKNLIPRSDIKELNYKVTKYGISIFIKKHQLYVGEVVQLKGREALAKQYFDLAKSKVSYLKYNLKRVKD